MEHKRYHFFTNKYAINGSFSSAQAYGRNRDAMDALKKAFTELTNDEILLSFNENRVIGPQGKVEDIVYTIFPTIKFSMEVKASNKRCVNTKSLLENMSKNR